VTVSLVTAGLICELIVHGLGAAQPHGRMREAVRLNLPVPHEDEPVTDRRLHR
jgi:hypothetical protein